MAHLRYHYFSLRQHGTLSFLYVILCLARQKLTYKALKIKGDNYGSISISPDQSARVNFCPNSPTYRRLAVNMATRLAERYGQHPALLIWHVSNEYGGTCFCETCAAAFRMWLQQKYASLDELNARWWTPFWGHTFT